MTDQTGFLPDDVSPFAEAYIWGYPLVAVQRTRQLFCSKVPSGILNHIDDLATPADRGVVVPNNDTLYSSGWYDLRHGDLTITVPPMDHAQRYWNLMVVDAYTHVAYVCRRHHGTQGTSVRVTHDPTMPPSNDASKVVRVATPTAWVIIRVLVESPDDLVAARALQLKFAVLAPRSHPQDLSVRGERPTTIAKTGGAYFSELQGYREVDPPGKWQPALSNAAQSIVDNPTGYTDVDLAAGVSDGESVMQRLHLRGSVQQNGWSTGRESTGFGSDIVKRALGAKFGLGGHQAIENRSYTAQQDADGDTLNGSSPLQLTFAADALPPCTGFWSLTAYGTDLYLIENEIDRWSLGDRTPGLVYAADGSLTIQISADRPVDSANWLPVAPGPYLLGLRVYEGLSAVVDCSWFPPQLAKI